MEITVACPECAYHLHLPSRDYLGRKGKCPQCGHKFVMQEFHAAASPPKPGSPPKPASPKPEKPADTGKTRFEPAPLPEPSAADFETLKDPGPVGRKPKAEGKKTSPKAGASPADPKDSAPLPEDFFEDVATSEDTESSASGHGSSHQSRIELGGHAARCPRCHRVVPFHKPGDLTDLACPHCESRFSLVHPESPAEAVAMPAQVGIYQIQKQTRAGVGPFGIVFRAKDGQTKKPIAIKVSWGDKIEESEFEEFLTALRSVMQLRHPNIVTLHEVDRAGDRVYIVSDFVPGIELSEYLGESSERKLSFREIAGLCAQIAGGLHHAHRFDVVHGNLKPANIRLDADLQPYLMDFALNKRRRAIAMTADGLIVGNAAYMAPEQLPHAEGRTEADQLSDVYAVGVILYELLAGRKPFPSDGGELLKQIAQGRPPGPRSVNPSVPKPLETICMKCLEVHPRDRYQSAMDVVKELRRFLQDLPIQTKPPGMLTRIGRWCRRRPILFGMLLTFTLLGAAGAGFVGWQIWQTGGFAGWEKF